MAKDSDALPQAIKRCLLVLSQSTQKYAVLWVGGYLKKLVATHYSLILLDDLVAINSVVLRRISDSVFESDHSSLATFCAISAAVTVLGWTKSEETFANALLPAWVLLLYATVCEMSQEKSVLNGFPKHRKTAVNFRDSHLLPIFRGGVRMFQDTVAQSPGQPTSLTRDIINLLSECLAFDFIGINPDESSEDQSSVHIIECMTYIFCARRSLFTDTEREQFTATNMQILCDVLGAFDRLSEEGVHPWQKIAEGCGTPTSELGSKYRQYILLIAQVLIQYDGEKLEFERDDQELLYQVLESCASILRFDYASIVDILGNQFKMTVDSYLGTGPKIKSGDSSLACAWATILIGAVVGGSSYTSRMLKKSQVILYLVEHHSSDNFAQIRDAKLLQQFFAGITKLLILESNESFDKELAIFLLPLQTELDSYKGMSDEALLDPAVSAMASKTFRKLRAIMSVLCTRKHFQPFFEWIMPHMFLFQRLAILTYSRDDNIAALRFFQEFVMNKSSRLNFDVNSASGIIIFREVSQVFIETGCALVKSDLTTIPESQHWPKVFKRITILLEMLKNILGGRYVCFGVFSIYNDPVLANTLAVMFALSRFIEGRYLLEFSKLGFAFLGVWTVFTGEQLVLVDDIDLDTFAHLLRCCSISLHSSNGLVSSQACSTIDNIFSHVCQRHIRGKAPDMLFTRVQQTTDLCRDLLATLLDKVINEDISNQWSMTRPLLPLILLFSEFFQSYVEQMISEQRPQYRDAFSKAVVSVMDGVTVSLEVRNRDRFTTNISNVRRKIAMEASSPA
eukprot:jgi/Hompol1/6288/HPOL_002237-RA